MKDRIALLRSLFAIGLVSTLFTGVASAQLAEGDVLAIHTGFDATPDGLYKIHESNGTTTATLLSASFFYHQYRTVAIGPSGRIFVTADSPQAVYEIDPINGSRTVISCISLNPTEDPCTSDVGFGPAIQHATGMAVETGGNLLISSGHYSTLGSIFRVNLVSGERSVVSGLNPNTGLIVGNFIEWANGGPLDVALKANGSILAVAHEVGLPFGSSASIFEINPSNGDRAIVSGPSDGVDLSGNGQEFLRELGAIDVASNGQIFALSRRVGSGSTAVWAVDPFNGNRQVVSGEAVAGLIGAGPWTNNGPNSLRLDHNDQPIVGSSWYTCQLIQVDLNSGGDRSCLLVFTAPFVDIAVVGAAMPVPTLDANGLLVAILLLAASGAWTIRTANLSRICGDGA